MHWKRGAFLCVLAWGCALFAAQEPAKPNELLPQTQAADVIGTYLTLQSTQTQADLSSLRAYFAQQQLPEIAPSTTPRPRLAYDQVYQGALQFIRQDGAASANPDLAEFSDFQLQHQFKLLQAGNLHQYLALNRLRDQVDMLQESLQSSGQAPAYQRWLTAGHKSLPATRPSIRSAEDITLTLRGIAPLLQQMRKTSPAKADESSPPSPDVIARIKAASEFEESLKTSDLPHTPPPATRPGEPATGAIPGILPTQTLPRTAIGRFPVDARRARAIQQAATESAYSFPSSINLTPDDPRWQPNFYGPGVRWNDWNADYAEEFVFSRGGGHYMFFDKRVNTQNDLRLNGDSDRRVNTDAVRRINEHVDPRVNLP